MTHPTDPAGTPNIPPLTDDEMLNILRRVQSGELSVEQAERLLDAPSGEREEQGPDPLVLDYQDFSAPLGKTANGKLVFERGMAGLSVRGELLPGQLFTAHFERHVPVVRVNGGTVTIRYRDFGLGLLNWFRYGFNPPAGQVALNAGIPWQIEIHNGLAQSHLDLHQVKLRGVTIHGGSRAVELRLGEPNGRVSFNFHGGVNNVTILRPATVAVRLTVHGSAANLALDSQEFGAIADTVTLETPNSQWASHCYSIALHGGADNFKIATLKGLS